jgi:hypothetical protein
MTMFMTLVQIFLILVIFSVDKFTALALLIVPSVLFYLLRSFSKYYEKKCFENINIIPYQIP